MPNEEDAEEKDLTSEEEEEWVPDEYIEDVEEEEDAADQKNEQKKSKKKQKDQAPKEERNTWAEWTYGIPESDEESGDDEDLKFIRQQAREEVRNHMRMRTGLGFNGSAWDQPDVWVPDQRDMDILAEMVVSPLMRQSSKWRSFHNDAAEWVKQLVLSGEMPKGKKRTAWLDVATTPHMYVSGLKVLLGKLQQQFQETTNISQRLPEGRLHIWAMLDFNTPHHINFPETIMDTIKMIPSPSMQKFAFAGYKQLLQSAVLWLSTVHAVDMFSVQTVMQEGMSEEQFLQKVIADNKHAKMDRLQEQKWIQQILTNIEYGKPWGAFQGDISWWAKQKEEYMEKFSGKEPLDSSCVTRFLNHQITRDFYRELMNEAESNTAVTRKQMVNLGRQLLKRWHLKNGFRQEIWGKFTLQHWMDAINGPDASFPYLLAEPGQNSGLDLQNEHVASNVHQMEGVRVYVRKDPFQPDPLDPQDPMQQEDTRDLLLGKCTLIHKHKTHKYPCYIWLSKWDVLHGRCYEKIRNLYLRSIGKNPEDLEGSFFINSKGGATISPHSEPLEWSDFSVINQCGKVSSHIVRKLVSDYISNQKDAVLTEGREYFMCNSDQVDKDHYQSQLRKKSLALMTAATYRTNLGLEEDQLMRGEGDIPCVDQEQRERERRGIVRAEYERRMKFLEREAIRDAAVKPSLKRLITNKEKVALVQCIIKCKDLKITKHGDMLDLFLSGMNVVNKSCGKALLRMLFMLDPSLQCVKVLKDSLVTFAELSPPTEDRRQLEWEWVRKLLMVINHLSRSTTIDSQNLIYNLTMLKETQPTGKEYFMGNPLIHHLVNTMEACIMARKASLTGEKHVIDSKEFLAKLNAKSLAALGKKEHEIVEPVLPEVQQLQQDVLPVQEVQQVPQAVPTVQADQGGHGLR